MLETLIFSAEDKLLKIQSLLLLVKQNILSSFIITKCHISIYSCSRIGLNVTLQNGVPLFVTWYKRSESIDQIDILINTI